MRAITDTRPRQMRRHRRVRPMEITLHVGAHRTATTSFQHYMRQNAPRLRRLGIGFWGPLRTRGGLFAGVMPDEQSDQTAFDKARHRIGTALDRAEKAGLRHLIISEENILGRPGDNLRDRRLYGRAGTRLARLTNALDGRIDRVTITVRPQQDYWPSLVAYAVHRGHPLPDAKAVDDIAQSQRLWQDTLREIAAAQTGEVVVLHHGCGPRSTLSAMIKGAIPAPAEHADHHLNAAPERPELRAAIEARGKCAAKIPAGEGRWQPFDADQRAMLEEAWFDDHFWLAAGAGGLATWLPHGLPHTGTTIQPDRAGQNLPSGRLARGHTNGIEERRLVGSG